MCPICNVTDGAIHHYRCPNDVTKPKVLKREKNMKTAQVNYPNRTKWQLRDGSVLVMDY